VIPGTESLSSPVARVETPAIELRSISKSFGPVVALQDVSLSLERGMILGLLGDNGAGKSTLVNCVAGMLKPDSGQIIVGGKEAVIDSPKTARSFGIEVVHQNLALVNTLDVAENLFLNREIVSHIWPLRWIHWLDKKRMYRESDAVLRQLGIRVPSPRAPIEQLSGGQRQAVSVGRAVAWGRKIVLLDEPAAALGVKESRHVLDLTLQLKERGVAVLFISHNMQHVVEVCDRAVVLRHGQKVGDVAMREVAARDLVDLITGASAGDEPDDPRESNSENDDGEAGIGDPVAALRPTGSR
jgi:simple sugar transport system ATP-binding protein